MITILREGKQPAAGINVIQNVCGASVQRLEIVSSEGATVIRWNKDGAVIRQIGRGELRRVDFYIMIAGTVSRSVAAGNESSLGIQMIAETVVNGAAFNKQNRLCIS